MIDWSSSMQQTFEYYVVDPGTWKDVRLIDTIKSCTINRDSDAETLGSASIESTDILGECYVRVYLVAIQNGVREKRPLGTFLVQSPTVSFDGKINNVSMDAYTPLIELKENPPPIGYSLMKNDNIMDSAYKLSNEHARAPVVKTSHSMNLYNDFVANIEDTWLSFLRDLIANAKYLFDLDELGRILFAPKQELASLQPVWTYDDSNSSILYSSVTTNRDLYGVPNVVEVVYSNGKEYHNIRVVNDDSDSPTSTVNRGREIVYRDTEPALSGDSNERQLREYAEKLLRDLSSIEYTISYTHGYCPVRVGDCVRFNYSKAGLSNIKAKVINQSIKCEPGCPVSEKAVFTTKLWR